jgi:hypothetical protein
VDYPHRKFSPFFFPDKDGPGNEIEQRGIVGPLGRIGTVAAYI